MASNKIYKFRDIVEAQYFINGGLIGVQVFQGNKPTYFQVVGLTLTFVGPGPSGVVTFATGTNPNDINSLFFKDVKAQVELAVAGLTVTSVNGKIVFVETTPTAGVTLHPTGGSDAASVFGFDTANNSVGKVYAPSTVTTTPPCWTWSDTDNANQHVIYTWE